MFVLPENINKIPIQFVKKISHSDEIYSFIFKPLKNIEWGEGMHSKLYLEIFGRTYNKTFSYASLMSEGYLQFTMRAKSLASAYKSEMKKLKPGDKLYITKPEGSFDLKRVNRSIILVSNGVGLATYRPHILNFAKNSQGIKYLTQINVDRKTKLYAEEFNQITNQNDYFSSIYTNGRQTFYPVLDKEINNLIEIDGQSPLVYMVGSTDFVEAVYTYLKDKDFDETLLVTDGDLTEGLRCSCGSSVVCDCGGHEAPEFDYDLDDILA